MQEKPSCCEAGCQLCQKELEIKELQNRHKRDFSLQTIYRKDYHNNQVDLHPQFLRNGRRKNESSNIQGQPKSYFTLHSTYQQNYQHNNPERPIFNQFKPDPVGKGQSFQSYKSTYQSNYHQHPSSKVEQSYKIADPQFYNLKTPFSEVTQYKKNFKAKQKTKIKYENEEFKNQEKKQKIRLFQTTQRNSYLNSRHIEPNLPIIPQNNVTTLPTTPFLFNTTYRNEFAYRSKAKERDDFKQNIHLANFYHF